MTTETESLPPLPELDATPAYTYEEEGYVLIFEDLSQHAHYLSPDYNDLDDAGADFVMNRLAGYKEEYARRKKAFEQFERQSKSKIDWLERRYASALQKYAATKLLGMPDLYDLTAIASWENVKKKTVNLPCGAKLSFKNTSPALVVNNEDAFQAWVVDKIPDAFEFVPKVDKKAVNEYWKKTGEVPPGTHAKPATVGFHLTF